MTLYKNVNGIKIKLTQQETDSYNDNNNNIKSEEAVLQEKKNAKISKIKDLCKIALYKDVFYDGYYFKNSESSGNNLQAAYNFHTDPFNWLDIDSNIVSLSKTDALKIIRLIMNVRSTAYFEEASHINNINIIKIDEDNDFDTCIEKLDNVNIIFT